MSSVNVSPARDISEAEARKELIEYHDEMALVFKGRHDAVSDWHRSRARALRAQKETE